MNSLLNKVIVGVGMLGCAISLQAAQVTSPANGVGSTDMTTATNRLLQAPCRINWISAQAINATNALVYIYDMYTNAISYTIAAQTNMIQYSTNYIPGIGVTGGGGLWTNTAGVTQSNFTTISVVWTATNTVAASTVTAPLIAAFTVPASTTAYWTNTTGGLNQWGILVSNSGSRVNYTIDYSPIH